MWRTSTRNALKLRETLLADAFAQPKCCGSRWMVPALTLARSSPLDAGASVFLRLAFDGIVARVALAPSPPGPRAQTVLL